MDKDKDLTTEERLGRMIEEGIKKALELGERKGEKVIDPRIDNPSYDSWEKTAKNGVVSEIAAPPSISSPAEDSFLGQIAKSSLMGYRKGMGQSGDVHIKAPSFTPLDDLRSQLSTERSQTIIPVGRRTDFITNLIRVEEIEDSSYHFMRETPSASGAGTRFENIDTENRDSSERSGYSTELETAVMQKFDTFIEVPEQAFEDMPSLIRAIGVDLEHKLYLERDSQIWAGSGVSPNMRGFTTDHDITETRWSEGLSGDNRADAYLRAILKVWARGYVPSGIFGNDVDWARAVSLKGSDGHYLIPQAHTQSTNLALWSLPFTRSIVPSPGTSLVGAFQTQAVYKERKKKTVKLTDSHGTNFAESVIAMMVSARGALAVEAPDAFEFLNHDSAPVPA